MIKEERCCWQTLNSQITLITARNLNLKIIILQREPHIGLYELQFFIMLFTFVPWFLFPLSPPGPGPYSFTLCKTSNPCL